ncbi:YdcF family protein [Halobacillus salinarum]|uniref:YdcF family protein n=1 Tax=Halobacillus salinarum TaxID=2932257 RepID=A0ABY4EP62_9BACI|nr:YdcF family protein [Halobacillus salinarum]UOQ45871.1 YdcF family protein [Halobacillus salinarum]
MKKIILFVFLAILAYIAYTGISIWTYGSNKHVKKADAAIVLGAAQWNGRPSPVFEGRLKEAIELYKEDKVNYLIFTGGSSQDAASSEAAVGKQYAMDHGVPDKAILYEDRSLKTETNLRNAKEVAEKNSIQSYLLVSDRYHLKRAVALAQNADMKNVTGIPTKYSAYKTRDTKLPFFFKEWGYFMGYQVMQFFR